MLKRNRQKNRKNKRNKKEKKYRKLKKYQIQIQKLTIKESSILQVKLNIKN